MLRPFTFGRDTRVNLLLGAGHFLSHFYQLCLPPLFIAWQQAFAVSFAELGVAMAVMSGTAALLQTPMGFLVDRYGARPFLIGGTLVMTLSIAAMGFTTAYWQIVLLALLSGVGNSVFHPADYAILSGSIDPTRLGRSFAFHTFTGNIGFAAAPPATAALMLLFGWRGALMFVGLLGLPVAATIGAATLLVLVDAVALAEAATLAVLFVAGLLTGASRTPRDVMVKDAAPPGQIGKVFGFVSSGMSLGGAIMPVPYGMIIDAGRPDLVLVVVATLLLLSLLCAGGARVGFRHAPVPVAAE